MRVARGVLCDSGNLVGSVQKVCPLGNGPHPSTRGTRIGHGVQGRGQAAAFEGDNNLGERFRSSSHSEIGPVGVTKGVSTGLAGEGVDDRVRGGGLIDD